MSEVSAKPPQRRVKLDVPKVLAYEAPFLIERLTKNGTADSEQEALALFDAVKRYLIIAVADSSVGWHMYSLRVDEAWHQFILYTDAYAAFCNDFFGRYLSHAPNNAPSLEDNVPASVEPEEPPTFAGFQARYEDLFGTPLPDAWFDERSITPWRRVLNVQAGTWTVCDRGEKVGLLRADGRLLLTISGFAREALVFVARTRAFYVRELPGDLKETEKVSLITALVRSELLKIAP